MNRDNNSESLHNQLIKKQISTYKKRGYINIKADHIHYKDGSPKEVNGHVPDISAEKDGIIVICEVETIDSVDDKHTREQWAAFSNSPFKFDICVPRSVLSKAKQIAKEKDIVVNKFWWKK